MDLVKEIRKMCKEKNAIILAHYYTNSKIQEVADFIGDSLALAKKASQTQADIIVMCGVNFMGETTKILCPNKKVLIPEEKSTCSLAESCNAQEFEKFIKKNKGYTVISYVNTSADVKALTDVVVTSSNAKSIVETFPKDAKLIFGPDKNLGGYINKETGRKMLLWNGSCHVHSRFSKEKIKELKESYPEAKVLVHPECEEEIVNLADKVGSTAALLDYAIKNNSKEYIVVTESGILYEMQKKAPNKKFIPAPTKENNCNECEYMRMITLEKLYNTLKSENPEIKVSNELIEKALKPIKKMLELS